MYGLAAISPRFHIATILSTSRFEYEREMTRTVENNLWQIQLWSGLQ